MILIILFSWTSARFHESQHEEPAVWPLPATTCGQGPCHRHVLLLLLCHPAPQHPWHRTGAKFIPKFTVPVWARIYSQTRFPKHQTCCWGALSTLLPAWLLKMKQRYGWLQLIPHYHASGLMWIHNEAREAACSDMNQAKLLGMISPVSGPSTRDAVEFLKSSQKERKKREKNKRIICLYLNNEMTHFHFHASVSQK